MVYKNIQSLASGETKDMIIHIGPILYTPTERDPCTLNITWIYNSPCENFTTLKPKHDQIKPFKLQTFSILTQLKTPTAAFYCHQTPTRLSTVYQKSSNHLF